MQWHRSVNLNTEYYHPHNNADKPQVRAPETIFWIWTPSLLFLCAAIHPEVRKWATELLPDDGSGKRSTSTLKRNLWAETNAQTYPMMIPRNCSPISCGLKSNFSWKSWGISTVPRTQANANTTA